MTDPTPPQWERAVLERVALKALEEQRRARQWSALFKLLFFLLAFTIVAGWLGWIGRGEKEAAAAAGGKHTAVVDLQGVIAPEGNGRTERPVPAPAPAVAVAAPAPDAQLLGGVAAAMALVKAHRTHGHQAAERHGPWRPRSPTAPVTGSCCAPRVRGPSSFRASPPGSPSRC